SAAAPHLRKIESQVFEADDCLLALLFLCDPRVLCPIKICASGIGALGGKRGRSFGFLVKEAQFLQIQFSGRGIDVGRRKRICRFHDCIPLEQAPEIWKHRGAVWRREVEVHVLESSYGPAMFVVPNRVERDYCTQTQDCSSAPMRKWLACGKQLGKNKRGYEAKIECGLDNGNNVP